MTKGSYSFSISQYDVHDFLTTHWDCHSSLRILQARIDDFEMRHVLRRMKSQLMVENLKRCTYV